MRVERQAEQPLLQRRAALLEREAGVEVELRHVRPHHQHDHREGARAEEGQREQRLLEQVEQLLGEARRPPAARRCCWRVAYSRE